MRAWEPQPGEVTPRNHGKPWAAFKVFRDLGPGRTLKAAAAAYYGHTADTLPEGNYGTVKKWASKFDWHERVKAFDDHYTMRERVAIEEWRNRQAEDVARREAKLRERSLAAREQAMQQVERMLGWPLTTQKALETDEEGNVITMIFAPAGWSMATIPGLFRMAVGDGEPAEEPDTWAEADLSGLSYEELHKLLELYQKVRPGGPGAGT